jgi:hypothetical protein
LPNRVVFHFMAATVEQESLELPEPLRVVEVALALKVRQAGAEMQETARQVGLL